MAEYIEKQDIYDAIDLLMTRFPYKVPGRPDTYHPYNEAWADACSYALDLIRQHPPADVRPVVLCGDCRWFNVTGYPDPDLYMPELRMGHCFILGRDVQACWFCGFGEQKEDANNLMEAIERNTTKIVEKSNVIRAEYIRQLQEKNKALDEELASLREAFLQATRGGRVDVDEKD